MDSSLTWARYSDRYANELSNYCSTESDWALAEEVYDQMFARSMQVQYLPTLFKELKSEAAQLKRCLSHFLLGEQRNFTWFVDWNFANYGEGHSIYLTFNSLRDCQTAQQKIMSGDVCLFKIAKPQGGIIRQQQVQLFSLGANPNRSSYFEELQRALDNQKKSPKSTTLPTPSPSKESKSSKQTISHSAEPTRSPPTSEKHVNLLQGNGSGMAVEVSENLDSRKKYTAIYNKFQAQKMKIYQSIKSWEETSSPDWSISYDHVVGEGSEAKVYYGKYTGKLKIVSLSNPLVAIKQFDPKKLKYTPPNDDEIIKVLAAKKMTTEYLDYFTDKVTSGSANKH